ncbi:MAG: 2-oxoacid:acceptor oxidoreductase family protein, partial [Halieaceae bacterium]
MSQGGKTLNLLIAALGGEGGGVLTNWLIEIADRSGWHCQSTSLAGVAQRTGATIYYLEFMERMAGKSQPVMSLFPAQGDIDVALTSEIAEAG